MENALKNKRKQFKSLLEWIFWRWIKLSKVCQNIFNCLRQKRKGLREIKCSSQSYRATATSIFVANLMTWKVTIKRKLKRYLNWWKVLEMKSKVFSEKYFRRNCLLLHRLKEELEEDADDVFMKFFTETQSWIKKILTWYIVLENRIVAMKSLFLS